MHKHLIPAAVLLAALASAAQAQTIIYNNTTSLKSAFVQGGATDATPVTNLVADDINPVKGTAGLGVTKFTFTVYNSASAAVTAVAHVRFYADNAPGFTGGPGTYLGGVDFNPFSFTNGRVTALSSALLPSGSSYFTIPTDQSFWAGVTFDGSTTANLNSLGQGLYNPPTVGGSDDMFFVSDSPGLYASNNPAGGSDYYFGGNPVANFGWQFQVASIPAPEPSQFAALGIGILGLGGLILRRRARTTVSSPV